MTLFDWSSVAAGVGVGIMLLSVPCNKRVKESVLATVRVALLDLTEENREDLLKRMSHATSTFMFWQRLHIVCKFGGFLTALAGGASMLYASSSVM